MLIKTIKQVKKIIIGIIGLTILIIGVAMLVLPGPAFIVIPIGLSILATEFIWAKKLLTKIKTKISEKLHFKEKQ
ncbi:MAG: PGPGW domain-containing protein [bacterium]